MSEPKPKRRRKPKAAGPTLFVNHQEIARDMGVSTKSVLRWIDAGEFPLPHSIQGTFRLYLRADYDHYVRTRRWPSHAKMIARQA